MFWGSCVIEDKRSCARARHVNLTQKGVHVDQMFACLLPFYLFSPGSITVCAPGMSNREAACRAVIEQTGATFIPPYNHKDVIAGQGTIALELIEQVSG